jgi:hypothetical protein
MNYQEKKVKIFAFYYKPGQIVIQNHLYEPVWAGKNGKENIPGFTGDDSGDNISSKNRYFSELTGIYWVWKNTDFDIVGSCHYRRYFTCAKEPVIYRLKRLLYFPAGIMKKRFGLIYTSDFKRWEPQVLSNSEVLNLLENYDAILPARRKLRQSVEQHYKKYHNANDLLILHNILEEYYPEYLASFDTVLVGNRLFANNMFVLKRNTFEELMNWLFFVLFKFEERTDLTNYKGYQERILGFLSERLITLWVIHNNINYKELPLIYFKKLKQKTYA